MIDLNNRQELLTNLIKGVSIALGLLGLFLIIIILKDGQFDKSQELIASAYILAIGLGAALCNALHYNDEKFGKFAKVGFFAALAGSILAVILIWAGIELDSLLLPKLVVILNTLGIGIGVISILLLLNPRSKMTATLKKVAIGAIALGSGLLILLVLMTSNIMDLLGNLNLIKLMLIGLVVAYVTSIVSPLWNWQDKLNGLEVLPEKAEAPMAADTPEEPTNPAPPADNNDSQDPPQS